MRLPSPTVQLPLSLRPFGLEHRDLAVDFGARPLPWIVTEILACCAQDGDSDGATGPVARQDASPVNQQWLWDLEVGQRLAALIRVAIGPGSEALDFSLTCHNTACARQMDLNLTLAELAEIEQQVEAAGLPRTQVGEITMTLRRPSGREQLAWQHSNLAGGPLAAEQMVRALIVEPAGIFSGQPIPPEYLAAAEAALDRSDPLVNFIVRVACPYCGITGTYPVDLQKIALRRLELAQAQLVAEVHTLACRYHWTEPAIMALPAWRRHKYLALLEKEPDGLS